MFFLSHLDQHRYDTNQQFARKGRGKETNDAKGLLTESIVKRRVDLMGKNDSRKRQQVGVFMTLPFVLATPPIIGWFIGKWLDKQMHTSPYLKYACLILGVVAGARECYRMIKEYGET